MPKAIINFILPLFKIKLTLLVYVSFILIPDKYQHCNHKVRYFYIVKHTSILALHYNFRLCTLLDKLYL